MLKPVINKPVPDFELPSTGGKTIKLSELKGSNLVIYFYPKDNTTGCTLEAQAFNANRAKFKRLNTIVMGVSRDSLKSHEGFRRKLGLKFDLLSDEKARLCRAFGVIKLKSMYGRKYRGIERSTFLIDAKGVLRHEWRKVSVSGHVNEILKVLKTTL
ncbi:MAG: peroxiredoxin [Gammaproteobacteria bacterium]|nr:peroxiredoxin [Gammaproteobacteria bacterium]MDE2345785.1 peroxiredoxin [Gammaproteobacteria bacterium]